MAFLDNEQSITIDAVLTTSGRKRLAAGDGSFNISGFSLGDDEINYALYNANHSQGSAYYDLNILKTPVLEAFSSTGASLRHKLLTIPRKDLLHLPVLRLNTNRADKGTDPGRPLAGSPNTDMYVVLCTKNGFDAFAGSLPNGFIDGRDSGKASAPSQLLVLDQGLDTSDTSAGTWESPIDDDPNYYYGYPSAEERASKITGPRGFTTKYGCRASAALRNSNFLFNKFGRQEANWWNNSGATTTTVAGSTSAWVLDTTWRIMGNKTGISLDVPIRFVREYD